MKFLKIFSLIFVLIVGAVYGYMHLSFRAYVADTEMKCLAYDFSSEIVTNHKQKFCSCTANFVRAHPFLSRSHPEGRQKFDDNTAFCYNQISRIFARSECNGLSARDDAGDGFDCSCYEDEFVAAFGFTDAGLELDDDSAAQNATLQIMKTCRIDKGE